MDSSPRVFAVKLQSDVGENGRWLFGNACQGSHFLNKMLSQALPVTGQTVTMEQSCLL